MEKLTSGKIFSVSELTLSIKSLLENNFSYLSIQGEISNFKKHSSGHLYFSLKEETAQIAAVLFKGAAFFLEKTPKDGDMVIVKGSISVYPPRGNYQIIVKEIEFLGIGELTIKLHQLKEKLKKRGWFEQKHKKKLPTLPKKIGVVTSPTGAVIQDILNVLKRRFSNIHLILNPVQVQGEKAPLEIAKAIEDFNRYKLADVLIIGRGGGSLEDLWAFNEEVVAKAIFESTIPIISAVGHETDFSISDFVADVRAPTPSAAAEVVIAEKELLLKRLKEFKKQAISLIFKQISRLQSHLSIFKKQPSFSSSYSLLSVYWQKIDDIKEDINLAVKHKIKNQRLVFISLEKRLQIFSPSAKVFTLIEKLKNYTSSLGNSWSSLKKTRKIFFNEETLRNKLYSAIFKILKDKREKLNCLNSHLVSINPKNLLKRGFSILFSEKENSIILSTKGIKKGQKFYALLGNGTIKAKVEEIKNDGKKQFYF